MTKRILAVVLAVLMVVGYIPAISAANQKVEVLQQKNIVAGRDGGDLALDQTLTRAEFIKLLVHASKLEHLVAGVDTNVQSFSDVSANHWAINYIELMKKLGVANGMPDGNFYPDKTISYQEILAFIVRLDKNFVEKENNDADWAKVYVDYAKANGLLEGIVESDFSKESSREGAFEIIYNSLSLLENRNKIHDQIKVEEEKQEEKKEEKEEPKEEKKEEKNVARKEEPKRKTRKDENKYRDDYYPEPTYEKTTHFIEWETLAPKFVFIEDAAELEWPKNQGITLKVKDNLGNMSDEFIYVHSSDIAVKYKNYFSSIEELAELLRSIDFAFEKVELVDEKGNLNSENPSHIKLTGPKLADKKQVVIIETSIQKTEDLIEVIDYEFMDYGGGIEPAKNWNKEYIDGHYLYAILKLPVYDKEADIERAMTIDGYKVSYICDDNIWKAVKGEEVLEKESLQELMDIILGKGKSTVDIGPDPAELYDPDSILISIYIPRDLERENPLVIETEDFGFHSSQVSSVKCTADEDSIKIFDNTNEIKFEYIIKK